MDQRAYLNRMLRLALPFFRRRNIPREKRFPQMRGTPGSQGTRFMQLLRGQYGSVGVF